MTRCTFDGTAQELDADFVVSNPPCLLMPSKVVEDMTEECSKYGTVAAIEIPHVGGPTQGVGYVFVKYNTREEAQKVGGVS